MEMFARLIGVLYAYEKLRSGSMFTVYVNLDNLIVDGPIGMEDVNIATNRKLNSLLQPIYETITGLIDNLLANNQVVKDEVRGVGVNINVPWTDEQVDVLNKIENAINNFDTFIKI